MNDFAKVYKILNEKIEDADMVLIGCGELLSYDWSRLSEDETYNSFAEQLSESEADEVYASFVQKLHLMQHRDSRLLAVYNKLAHKLEGKNYFVLSLGIDDVIYDSDLNHERIVTPCGGFQKMQCPDGCQNEIYEIPNDLLEQVEAVYPDINGADAIAFPVCPVCGKKLVFNQLGTGRYVEKGYLPQWETYMKWLTGTMNKKVCMVELGVGLQFPSVIRKPFENVAYYNLKSYLFRVHPMLFQVEQSIDERACGIQTNPMEFVDAW